MIFLKTCPLNHIASRSFTRLKTWQASGGQVQSVTREETLRAQLHLALCDPMDCSTPVRCLWNFPGKNAGMGFHFLLQLIFPTQGLKLKFLNLLHWQADSLALSHQGSPTLYTKGLQDVFKLYQCRNGTKCCWIMMEGA